METQVLAERIIAVSTLKVPITLSSFKRREWNPATVAEGSVNNVMIHLSNDQLTAITGRSPVVPGAYRGLRVMAPITTVFGETAQGEIVDYNMMGVGDDHQLPDGMMLSVDLLVTQWTVVLTIKRNATLDVDVWLD